MPHATHVTNGETQGLSLTELAEKEAYLTERVKRLNEAFHDQAEQYHDRVLYLAKLNDHIRDLELTHHLDPDGQRLAQANRTIERLETETAELKQQLKIRDSLNALLPQA